MYEVGGAVSFCWRRLALRLVRGATVGAFTLATVIVSLRLCPGTPSKVAFASPGPFALVADVTCRDCLLLSLSGGGKPSRRAAARVILGATAGGAVLATVIVEERLCPGTFSNVCASLSLLSGPRGPAVFSTGRPARRAAARDIRGTMSGAACVEGKARALNGDLPLPPSLEPVLRSAERTEDDTERSEPLVVRPVATSGSSVVGNGGDDAKMAEICISAAGESGEPMTAFCSTDAP